MENFIPLDEYPIDLDDVIKQADLALPEPQVVKFVRKERHERYSQPEEKSEWVTKSFVMHRSVWEIFEQEQEKIENLKKDSNGFISEHDRVRQGAILEVLLAAWLAGNGIENLE